MKVTVEDVSSVKKILHIEIPQDEITRELDSAYQTLKKTAKVKGFRPGKAPRGVLERLYKKDVQADVSGKLIQSSFVEALKETELNILGSPQVDPPELDAAAPYQYDATVEIKPEVADIDYKGLALKKTRYQVSDGEIEGQLNMLQRNMTQQKPLEEERPLAQGDFALIDYEGFKDGQPFEETSKTENFTMKIGDGHISPEFDEKLVGMQPGDTREVVITFPNDYFNDKLKNVEVSFQVHLNEIRQEIIPAIDDELAKGVGPFETLDALKQAITDNLNQGYEKRVEQELNEQIFKALIEKTEFELPDVMVQFELENILNDAERSFSYHEKSMEDLGLTREKMAEQYQPIAEKQVRRHIILGKLIEQENLELSDEAMDKAFAEMAASFNQPVEQVKAFYKQSPDKLEFFKHTLLEKEAIKLIIESGSVEEVEPEAPAEKKPEKTAAEQ